MTRFRCLALVVAAAWLACRPGTLVVRVIRVLAPRHEPSVN